MLLDRIRRVRNRSSASRMNVNSSSTDGTSSRRATISGVAVPDAGTGSEPAWSQMRVDIGAIVAGAMGPAQSRRPTTFQAVTGWLIPLSDRPSIRSASTPSAMSRYSSSVTRIWPAAASADSRAARFTIVPTTA